MGNFKISLKNTLEKEIDSHITQKLNKRGIKYLIKSKEKNEQ